MYECVHEWQYERECQNMTKQKNRIVHANNERKRNKKSFSYAEIWRLRKRTPER